MARSNATKIVDLHMDPSKITFSLFTSAEIMKLSVVKIYTPLAFNSLGHPLPGGLYDALLGPLGDKGEICQTCFETVFRCPGHMGHIELPVPVINPIFNKMITSLLKITCTSCFRLQISDTRKDVLEMQLQLVDAGHLIEAQELDTTINDEDDPAVIEMLENKLKFCKNLLKAGKSDFSHNKNTESIRNSIITIALRQAKARKSCSHCKATLPKIKSYRNRLMMNVSVKDGDTIDIGAKSKKKVGTATKSIFADECRNYLRELWINEGSLIREVIPVLKKCNVTIPTDLFFFDIIPVPPPNVRPVNFINNKMIEHPQTQIYKSILETSLVIRAIMTTLQEKEDSELLDSTRAVFEYTMGATLIEKFHNSWQELQGNVDNLMDRDMSKSAESSTGQGLKQIIEKKEGIIRMHMMGKRVNYAARSVITPDPNLNIDEIGVPEAFAIKLSYPVPVTSWNVSELRKMVMNGPNKHPGALMVENEDGTLIKIPENDITKQESIAKRLLTPSENSHRGVKIVHRHLCNGDIMLLNRQPTLHKPSIMAHKARILPGEKTLRLHYANCKAYNADFDGDEMNAHFPQNELARSEGYNIVNVCNQYLVPKDGTPLSGLIQDHMVSGVRLSIRGKFFTREDYHMLVYQALAHIRGDIKLLPPAIVKPIRLWSGKQLISTLIINSTPRDRLPITLNATAKISPKAWETVPARKWRAGGTSFTNDNEMSEAEVVIIRGELLCGVLDKTHYGATPYGLIHCMFELYGGSYSSKLLSSFAKLFTSFLQREGFTLGVHDILVLKDADKKRTYIVNNSRKIGFATQASAVNLTANEEEYKITTAVEEAYSSNPKFRAILDRQYKQALDSYTNDINKTCLPAGLLSKFPYNNLQLMVQSGAKGSTVNTMQISCLLGQIELEGKRPPLMISGKSLPSFPAYEPSPRAGGFIDGRFMTGIQPQEFFFHCMAGREGLIDTAVKTSRSGYLQRCLIKHLEGLTVKYDLTVRDSDNSVVQFLYGEDGMDISKVQFLNDKQLQFLSDNSDVIVDKHILNNLKKDQVSDEILKKLKEIKKWKKKHGPLIQRTRTSNFAKFSEMFKPDAESSSAYKISKKTGRPRIAKKICELWHNTSAEEKIKLEKKNFTHSPDPLISKYQPDHYFGILSEKIDSLISSYDNCIDKSKFEDMIKFKAMTTLCPPGEPVGLLAAQSIGEPSTQMTLNTFHFAGRGEMNVTLGIPRLREILMMAAKRIKTPSMDIPFNNNVPNLVKSAEKLRKRLVKVTIADVLQNITVDRVLELEPKRQHKYVLKFNFLPIEAYKSEFCVKPREILKYMEKYFFSSMFRLILRVNKNYTEKLVIEDEKGQNTRGDDDDDDDDELDPKDKINKETKFGEDYQSSDEESVVDDEDATNTKTKARRCEGQTYDDKEEGDEDSDKDSGDESNNKSLLPPEEANAETDVTSSISYVEDYSIDKKNYLWCQLVFALPLEFTKINLNEILRTIAEKSVIWETPNIRRAITHKTNKQLMLKTDGINIIEMFKYNTLLDLNKLYSNDIHGIAMTYGIEAAGRVIVKEVQNVFNVYGITVDPRHLLLISDYMTYDGTYQPMSRKGMEDSASPLQQMSFESSLSFLKQAALLGKSDHLNSPSSSLMVGKPCENGTGSVTLMNSLSIST